jgi:arylsulfatase A-like enzyme
MPRFAMRRLAPTFAVLSLAVAAALLRCAGGGGAGASGGSAAARAAEGAPLRLLDRLDRAQVEADALAVLSGELQPTAPGDLALRDDFGDPADAPVWPRGWFESKVVLVACEDPARAAALPRITTAPEEVDGRGVVRVRRKEDSLTAVVAAAPEETWLVRARVKALGAPEGVGIDGRPLPFEPLPYERLLAEAPRLVEPLRASARERRLPADAGSEWRELRLVARPYPGRKSLAVTLIGGDGGALFDEIEVRRLTPLETLALTPDDSVEAAGNPLRRRVALGLETWDCLALPVPGTAVFEVDVPRERPRLDVGVAALLDGASEPVRLRVEVEGANVEHVRRAEQAAAPFTPLTLDLAAMAGRRVKLRLAAEGPRGAVALFGAPTLLSAPARSRPNVLLISLDTLRADHLGCYGATDVRSPRIDRLAAEGLRFETVLSPASYTLPTHMTLMSGQDPLVHATVKSTQPMDPARTPMLARRMQEAGWRTAAFTGGGLVHPRYGFGLGFDSYSIADPGGVVGLKRRIGDEADHDAAPGEDRVARIVEWLQRNSDQPFLLFVHTYLVHNYRPSQRDLDEQRGGPRPTPEELGELRLRAEAGEPEAIERMHALYRASIAQADREIVGRLLDVLDSLRLAERTIVVLVADHGEEFFEHAMIGHGNELWHDLTRVPWILRGPGVPRGPDGIVRADPVALGDVAPTIAALVGLEADARASSRSQLAADPDDNFTEPKLLSLRDVSERPDQDALVLWPWKIVRRRAGPAPWPCALYQLEDDPREERDLAAAHPERAAGLAKRLDLEMREQLDLAARLPASAGERHFEMPAELEWMLDQLGYGARRQVDHE